MKSQKSRKMPKNLTPGETCWIDRGIFARRTKTGSIRYGISYSYKGRRIQEIVGPTKTLAKKALEIRKSEIAQERFQIPAKRRRPTFGEYCQIYLEHARQKKRTWKDDEGALRIAATFFKSKRINEITSWDIERYRSTRAKTRTKATANRDLSLLRYMFNLAVNWGFLEESPVTSVRPFREDERPMRVLTVEEERALVEAAADHLKPIIITALNTGMRRGELLALDWDAVDVNRKIIMVKYSKSGRVRHIPVNGLLLNTLRQFRENYSRGRVFRYQGKPIADIKTAFRKAVRRSGIVPCRFHDLRHYSET